MSELYMPHTKMTRPALKKHSLEVGQEKPLHFDDFYQAWNEPVRRYCRAKGFMAPELDDLHQRIFFSIWRSHKLERYEAVKGTFPSYIWSHVHYTIMEHRVELAKLAKNYGVQYVREVANPHPSGPDFDQEDDGQGGGMPVEEAGFGVVECNMLLADTAQSLRHPLRVRSKAFETFDAAIDELASAGDVRLPGLGRALGVGRQAAGRKLRALMLEPSVQELRSDLHAA